MVLIATFALALAASLVEQSQAPGIIVERGPCLEECPVYRFQATASEGVFEGRRLPTFTANNVFRSRRRSGPRSSRNSHRSGRRVPRTSPPGVRGARSLPRTIPPYRSPGSRPDELTSSSSISDARIRRMKTWHGRLPICQICFRSGNSSRIFTLRTEHGTVEL